MDNCVFCKIVKWETPSQRVYEDDEFIAFLDINPVNFGHTLIIPREHYANFLETPEKVLESILKLAKKLAPAIMKSTGAPAFNVLFNNGSEAGQVIHHLHVHIIPRFEKDGHGSCIQGCVCKQDCPGRLRYAEGEMGATAKKIKERIK